MPETSRPPLPDSDRQHPPPTENFLDKAVRSLLAPIWDKLAKIETRLDASHPRTTPESGDLAPLDSATAHEPRAAPAPELAQLIAKMENLERLGGDLCQHLPPSGAVASPPPTPGDVPLFSDFPKSFELWENIVLGEELSQDPSWEAIRREFLDAVAEGDRAARFLAGHLMLVQNATAEKMSELLKNVGEAYYRWRPRRGEGDDPMEQALVRWLNRLVEQARLPNSIQLVRPGDRFDNSRHIAGGRGVEVVEVQGWVVLRDGNRVYTKANVTVK